MIYVSFVLLERVVWLKFFGVKNKKYYEHRILLLHAHGIIQEENESFCVVFEK